MGQKTDQIFERGKLFMEKGNHEQALRLFNQVLNREPQYRKALKNKVLIKIAEASEEEAKASIENALTNTPDDDELQQIAGSFYINNNEIEKGERHLTKAIELNPDNVLALYGLGIISANLHSDHQTAIRYFSEAINRDPNFAEAFFNRGCSYLMQDIYDSAHCDLLKARNLGHPKAADILQSHFN